MHKRPFEAMSTVKKWCVALAMYGAFVAVEELVIDRYHLDRFLPFYRVGNFCTYDAVAIVAILLVVFGFPRRWRA